MLNIHKEMFYNMYKQGLIKFESTLKLIKIIVIFFQIYKMNCLNNE